MKNTGQPILAHKSNITILLIIFSLFIIIAGYLLYLNEENIIRNEKNNELKAIAELKIDQIIQWKNERIADAYVTSRSAIFIKVVEQFLQNRKDSVLADDIVSRLSLISKQYGYENIMLAENRKILLSVSPELSSIDSFTQSKIAEAEKSKEIIITDFYFCKLHKKIHYDIISPIIDKNNQAISSLIMRRNPNADLYPLIQSWPTPSKTSETLLLRKEGNSVIYLNELRHKKDAVLNLRIPLTKKEVPAVQAALGYKGTFSGKDYRGIDVLSYVSHVPGTNWFMVAKIDKSELYRDLNFKAGAITILSILIILLLWFGLVIIYSSRQKEVYRALWQTQEEARTTLYSIGDGVLITDENGFVKHLNPVAEILTGWKEKDASGRPLEEVFNIIHEVTRAKVENPVTKVLKEGVIVELANHTILINKDGKEIPIADSGAPIKSQSNIITGAVLVFRDQSKERAKQKIIEESEAKYKSLFVSTNDGICLHEIVLDNNGKPADYIIQDVNKKYEEITGLRKEDVIGKRATEVYQSDTAPYLEVYADVAINGKSITFETHYEPMQKYFTISVYSPGKGKFATVFQDISERKRAEMALQFSEQRLKRAQEIAHLGSWELDLAGNSLTWTDEVYRIFGLEPQSFDATYEAFLEAIHPDDREAVNKAYSNSIQEGKDSYEIEHRIIRKSNGEIRFVHEKCEHFRDQSGKIIRSIGMVHDITTRKRAEEQIRYQANILENVSEAVISTTSDFIIRTWNKAAEKLYGWTSEEAIGEVMSKLVPSVYINTTREEVLKDFLKNNFWNGEVIQHSKDGRQISILASITMMKDTLGQPSAVIAINRDITERKQLEENLRRRAEEVEILMEVAPVAIWVAEDPQCNVISGNRTANNFYEAEYEENVSANASAVRRFFRNGVELKPEELTMQEAAAKNMDIRNSELDVLLPSGKWMHMLGSASPLRDASGNVRGCVGTFVDITERKIMEQALRESEAKLKEAQAIAHLGSFSFDVDKWIVEWSEELYRIFGRNPEDGDPILEETFSNVHPDDVTRMKEIINDSIENRNNIDAEYRIIRRGGEIRYLQTFGYPVMDDSGSVSKIFGAVLDITERKKVELKLEEALNELKRSNNDLEQFAYIASHDLQEPLRMIKSYTDLLVKRYSNSFDENQKEFFGYISDGASRMHQLINALLQYSRITSKRKEFELVGCSLVVQDALADLRIMIADSNAKILYDKLPEVSGDKTMLRILFQNLIQNAIKFRGDQDPEINISYEKKNGYWVIKIKDNGIGIAPEYHEKIFLIFQRLHGKDKYPGTGIGLATCKKIVEHHGGEICLDSAEGKGTTFYFTLPVI